MLYLHLIKTRDFIDGTFSELTDVSLIHCPILGPGRIPQDKST